MYTCHFDRNQCVGRYHTAVEAASTKTSETVGGANGGLDVCWTLQSQRDGTTYEIGHTTLGDRQ